MPDEEVTTVEPEEEVSEEVQSVDPNAPHDYFPEEPAEEEDEGEPEDSEDAEPGEEGEEPSEEDSDEPKVESDPEAEEEEKEEAPVEYEYADGEKESLTGVQVKEKLQELRDGYATIDLANERVDQANELYQRSQDVLRKVVEDPGQTLLDAFTGETGNHLEGYDKLVKFAVNVCQQETEIRALAPEEQTRIRMEMRFKSDNDELTRLRGESAERQRVESEAAEWTALMNELNPAMDTVGLEKSESNYKAVGRALMAASERGEQMTVAEGVAAVIKDRDSFAGSALEGMSVEDIVKLRPDLADKFVKDSIRDAKERKQDNAGKPQAKVRRKKKAPIEARTYSEEDYDTLFRID